MLVAAGLTALVLSTCFGSATVLPGLSTRHPRRTQGGVHLPIHRRESSVLRRRAGQTSAIGLGDTYDSNYNVLVTMGKTSMPVVLDTGSSDLWAISDACSSSCSSGVPSYSLATFQAASGLSVQLEYGDSMTGSYANGPIGTDTVSLAGLSLSHQYVAAVNNTNTLDAGSAGIFGLGFPINSEIWGDVFVTSYNRSSTPPSSKRQNKDASFNHHINRAGFSAFSKLSDLQDHAGGPPPELTVPIIQSWSSSGPLLSRLVLSGALAAPMFSITLQRDTVDIGGNEGLLSIGELPSGVQNSSLTWVPVRPYTSAEGGLSGPPDSPNEQYPMAWEVAIEDVYLDGQKLPVSTLSPTITPSALVDTGNSLIRGPPDVVDAINTLVGGAAFSCSTPHTLAFQIGGKLFPVDPRDFVTQASESSVDLCSVNLVKTDTPVVGNGSLYSWSLGDPFLKSVLSAYYYGNLTYPSRDPPRMGFLSTVPADAGDRLKADVQAAKSSGGNFPATTEVAPTGSAASATTNSNGVPQAKGTTGANKPSSTGHTNGAFLCKVSFVGSLYAALLAGMVPVMGVML